MAEGKRTCTKKMWNEAMMDMNVYVKVITKDNISLVDRVKGRWKGTGGHKDINPRKIQITSTNPGKGELSRPTDSAEPCLIWLLHL